MKNEEKFRQEQGVFVPHHHLEHREDEYDEQGFELLIAMQREHFWYRGRHRLLMNVISKEISRQFSDKNRLCAIDMGGGCGGWLEYLNSLYIGKFEELALADSSLQGLKLAKPIVNTFATLYQIDILDIPWSKKWDVVFLLDVLEHIPDQNRALRQIFESMRPGGLVFVTVPALNVFWTYNDDLVNHQRRYSRKDFHILAKETDFELLRTDYFMFFLSPILLASRIFLRSATFETFKQKQEHLARTHRIPARPINEILWKVFSLESLMVNSVKFPWGTSILAVLRK